MISSMRHRFLIYSSYLLLCGLDCAHQPSVHRPHASVEPPQIVDIEAPHTEHNWAAKLCKLKAASTGRTSTDFLRLLRQQYAFFAGQALIYLSDEPPSAQTINRLKHSLLNPHIQSWEQPGCHASIFWESPSLSQYPAAQAGHYRFIWTKVTGQAPTRKTIVIRYQDGHIDVRRNIMTTYDFARTGDAPRDFEVIEERDGYPVVTAHGYFSPTPSDAPVVACRRDILNFIRRGGASAEMASLATQRLSEIASAYMPSHASRLRQEIYTELIGFGASQALAEKALCESAYHHYYLKKIEPKLAHVVIKHQADSVYGQRVVLYIIGDFDKSDCDIETIKRRLNQQRQKEHQDKMIERRLSKWLADNRVKLSRQYLSKQPLSIPLPSELEQLLTIAVPTCDAIPYDTLAHQLRLPYAVILDRISGNHILLHFATSAPAE